jgi:hypothetical protein
MSQLIKLLSTLLFIASCQTIGSAFRQKEVYESEEFRKYVRLFEKYSREVKPEEPVKVRDLIIKFDKLDKPNIGQCRIWPGRTPVIAVDPDNWAVASDTEKEVLMLHELGHCVLRREHKADLSPNGTPISMMYPTVVVKYDYEDYKLYYLYELFSIRDDWTESLDIKKTKCSHN